jgi:hypothetical protein
MKLLGGFLCCFKLVLSIVFFVKTLEGAIII